MLYCHLTAFTLKSLLDRTEIPSTLLMIKLGTSLCECGWSMMSMFKIGASNINYQSMVLMISGNRTNQLFLNKPNCIANLIYY